MSEADKLFLQSVKALPAEERLKLVALILKEEQEKPVAASMNSQDWQYLRALESTLDEWTSEEDERAFRGL